MISAGDNSATRFDRRSETISRTCGEWASRLQVNRNQKCDTELGEKFTEVSENPPMTDQEIFRFSNYLLAGGGTGLFQCGFKKGEVTKNEAQKIVDCSSKLVLEDGIIKFAGKEMHYKSEFLPFAAKMAREGKDVNPDDVDVPLPGVLKNYIATLDPATDDDGNFFAVQANRLFRDAIKKVPGIREKFSAADKIGEKVKILIEDAKATFDGEKNAAQKQSIKDGLLNLFVTEVKKEENDNYKVTCEPLPSQLLNPVNLGLAENKKPTPLLIASLRNLYMEAQKYGEGKLDRLSLANGIAGEAKKLNIHDPDQLGVKLRNFKVDEVLGDPSNPKKVTEVKLKDLSGQISTKAPDELIDRLNARTDNAKIYALNNAWGQIVSQLQNQIDYAAENKLIGALAPKDNKAGPNNLIGKNANEIALLEVKNVNLTPPADSPVVTLTPMPASIVSTTEEAIKQTMAGVTDPLRDIAAMGVYLQAKDMHQVLSKNRLDGMTEEQVNKKVTDEVKESLFADGIKRCSNDATKNLNCFTGRKYTGFNPDGTPAYIIPGAKSDKDDVSRGAIGTKNGVHGDFEGDADVSGIVKKGNPPPSAATAKPGSDTFGMYLYVEGGIPKLFFSKDEKFFTGFKVSWLTFVSPVGVTPGVASEAEAFNTTDKGGATNINRINELSITPIGYYLYKGSKKSAAVLAFKAGQFGDSRIANANLTSGFDPNLAPTLSSSMFPTLGYPGHVIGGGNPTAGGRLEFSLNGEDVKVAHTKEHAGYQVKIRSGYGTTVAALSPTQVRYSGSKGLVDASGSLEICRGPNIQCSAMATFGYSWSNGDSDAIGKVPAQLNAYKSNIFYGSAAFRLQPAENFATQIEGRIASINPETSPAMKRFLAGIRFEFPVKTGEKSDIMPYLGFIYSVESGTMLYANTSGQPGSVNDDVLGPQRNMRYLGSDTLDLGAKMYEAALGLVFRPLEGLKTHAGVYYGNGTPLVGGNSSKSYGLIVGGGWSF